MKRDFKSLTISDLEYSNCHQLARKYQIETETIYIPFIIFQLTAFPSNSRISELCISHFLFSVFLKWNFAFTSRNSLPTFAISLLLSNFTSALAVNAAALPSIFVSLPYT